MKCVIWETSLCKNNSKYTCRKRFWYSSYVERVKRFELFIEINAQLFKNLSNVLLITSFKIIPNHFFSIAHTHDGHMKPKQQKCFAALNCFLGFFGFISMKIIRSYITRAKRNCVTSSIDKF